MKVFIKGLAGNMGQRYEAILRHLKHEVVGCDVWQPCSIPQDVDAVIIATPTNLHLRDLRDLLHCRRPVLCEKPFINDVRDMVNLDRFLRDASSAKMQLSMVSQYDFLLRASMGCPQFPETYYDYFRTGKDGLAWDCINIIWHAKDKISLENRSPIWRCRINGQILFSSHMDAAYVQMIESWLAAADKKYDYDLILQKHRKVLEFIDGKFDKGPDRNPGPQQQPEVAEEVL